MHSRRDSMGKQSVFAYGFLTGEPDSDNLALTTLIALSERMKFSAHHSRGLRSFLEKIWSSRSTAANASDAIPAMGFRPALIPCEIASCGHNEDTKPFKCSSMDTRHWWWFEWGSIYRFPCPPSLRQATAKALQEKLRRKRSSERRAGGLSAMQNLDNLW
jgi:hypothetical protein